MGTRKKTTVHTNVTAQQAEEAFAEYATATSGINKLTSEMEIKITGVREKYQDGLAALNRRVEETNAILMTYAMENENLFDKKKSIEMTHGKIGFRTGTPTVKNLKGFTWEAVKNLVKSFLGDSYVRIKEEVNKEAILAARDEKEIAAKFGQCGIEIRQEETFFVEPKEESKLAGALAMIALLIYLSFGQWSMVNGQPGSISYRNLLLDNRTGAWSGADTIITTPGYTSYFNYSFHGPDSVVYKLYHGGGDCQPRRLPV